MPVISWDVEEILAPISAARPAGEDLRPLSEWDRIKEARRSDDGMNQGAWKTERKLANWETVEQLVVDALKHRSKDLQLAIFLLEASIRRHGFMGLHDGVHLIRGLLLRFWDLGLFPLLQDQTLEDRSVPLEWLNEKLPDILREVPLTRRSDRGRDYSYVDLVQARRVGSEKTYVDSKGNIDDARRKKYQADVAAGRVSMEMYEGAIRVTPRAVYDEYHRTFQGACAAVKELELTVAETFKAVAPSFHLLREALSEIGIEIERTRKKTIEQEPAPTSEPATTAEGEAGEEQKSIVAARLTIGMTPSDGAPGVTNSWSEAERLVKSGDVDKGLAQMARLAATESSGRSRFQRKLLLAEVCVAKKRDRLARTILEELSEQIDKFQLEHWETPELVGAVWTRLYRIYKGSSVPADADRALKLYDRMSRLDPWQSLSCTDD